MRKNKVVDSFLQVDVSDLKFPIISVFYNPLDQPGKYVARMFDLDQPTDTSMVKDTLVELYEGFPPNLTRIPRQPNDHESVVEVWLY